MSSSTRPHHPCYCIRDQILANVVALYPDNNPGHLNIMTGCSPLDRKYDIKTADNYHVTQYMHWANVFCYVWSTEDPGKYKRATKVLMYGEPVVGTTKDALAKLAAMVEGRVDAKFGVQRVKHNFV